MKRALELARCGWGRVSPNPLVGAVVARHGVIVGEGFHAAVGGAHAEVAALAAAGDRAREATLYVTLEPCRHQGRTPPCTARIIEAGVRKVVFSVADPTAAGGGAEELRQAGIEVESGLLLRDSVRLNAPFLWRTRAGRPFVALKLALSADGAMAARPGERTSISGPEAWAEVHRLRAGVDAVLVGRRTVEADDPLLTPRGSPLPARPPLRVVLAGGGRIPETAALVRTARDNAVLVFVPGDDPSDHAEWLREHGVEVEMVARAAGGLALEEVLARLVSRGIQSLLVEGGARVASNFLAEGLVERYHQFVSEIELGPEGVAGPSNLPSDGVRGWRRTTERRVGGDVYTEWERIEVFESLVDAG